jgi:prepilin-type N-terminal cleavage/methylation domain-containing protein
MKNGRNRLGFSLLEIVIVVAIMAVLAAIAIPRMGRGSRGAGDSALGANLAVLRSSVDLYAAEHQGTYPAVATFSAQLTQYSDAQGATAATKDATHIYGPYVRTIPSLPVGAKKGSTGVAAADADGVGWIYTAATGTISANAAATEKDDAGTLYSSY